MIFRLTVSREKTHVSIRKRSKGRLNGLLGKKKRGVAGGKPRAILEGRMCNADSTQAQGLGGGSGRGEQCDGGMRAAGWGSQEAGAGPAEVVMVNVTQRPQFLSAVSVAQMSFETRDIPHPLPYSTQKRVGNSGLRW